MKNVVLLILFIAAVNVPASDTEKLKQTFPQSRSIITPEKGISAQILFNGAEKPAVDEVLFRLPEAYGLPQGDQLKVGRIDADALGQKHHRVQQFHAGYEIEHAQLIIHEKNGLATSVQGAAIAAPGLPALATVSESDALASALRAVPARRYMWENPENDRHLQLTTGNNEASYFPAGKLLYSSGALPLIAGNLRLAWKFDVFAAEPLRREAIYVDALTGEVFHRANLLLSVDQVSTGKSLYNDTVSFMSEFSSGSYRLRETGRGAGIRTYDTQNTTDFGNAVDFLDPDTAFFGGNEQAAGVSAHWGAELVWDYYMNEHGRNSYNNIGGVLLSYVHYGSNIINAYWSGDRMLYGDGDGLNAGPLVSVDVAGHEITHGVTQFTAGLIYANESGALNESFSDVFGAAIEFYAEGDNADWLIGEDFGFTFDAFRDMSDPNSFGDPDTYKGMLWKQLTNNPNGNNDWGGVHSNSGVQNFWYYLLSEGGSGTNDIGIDYSVNGLGVFPAAEVAYRNLSTYLLPSSGFYDARWGAMQAAADIYGQESAEFDDVVEAWNAVGVLRPAIHAMLYTTADTLNFLAEAGLQQDSVSFTFYNYGIDSLHITGLDLQSGLFSVINMPELPLHLGYVDSVTITIEFTPQAEGQFQDSLVIHSNDADMPQRTIYFSGKGWQIHATEPGNIYAVTGTRANGAVLLIDSETGAANTLGESGYSSINGSAIDPTTGLLYGSTIDGVGTRILRVNPADGAAYPSVYVPVALVRAIAFSNDGDLYGTVFSNGDMVQIDMNSGDTTLVAHSGVLAVMGMAVNPLDGSVWLSTAGDKIHRVDPDSGTTSLIGATGFSKSLSIAFDEEGKLFGLSDVSSSAITNFIYIDPATGAGTLIGATGFKTVYGMAINGSLTVSDVPEISSLLPQEFALQANYPNPFNPETTIRFDLPATAQVELKVFDITGREVRNILSGNLPAGFHEARWDGSSAAGSAVSSGMYFYTLTARAEGRMLYRQTRKMILLR